MELGLFESCNLQLQVNTMIEVIEKAKLCLRKSSEIVQICKLYSLKHLGCIVLTGVEALVTTYFMSMQKPRTNRTEVALMKC